MSKPDKTDKSTTPSLKDLNPTYDTNFDSETDPVRRGITNVINGLDTTNDDRINAAIDNVKFEWKDPSASTAAGSSQPLKDKRNKGPVQRN